MINKIKQQPTVVNGYWKMSWIENNSIAYRDMTLFERIRYLPRIILQEITGYKFPKY